ncbi:hypothetical protein O181_006051 [Austropuccinia psidii MF-1]|uniref:Uncharacterized protein n=1 Tax=Austropuccinia psidii MF-1 TaxID=1389203 RepID=A0A9Q3BIG3_9BASI|nr:hypothetical protein [Austropuccinia psidii MF-1]
MTPLTFTDFPRKPIVRKGHIRQNLQTDSSNPPTQSQTKQPPSNIRNLTVTARPFEFPEYLWGLDHSQYNFSQQLGGSVALFVL